MFAHFCGFGPGHKSTYLVTKVFRDEIKETFGFGDGKDDMGENLEGIDHDVSEHADEKEFDNVSDGDSDAEEDGEPEILWDCGDDLDYVTFEEELGYAPL
jgi:hypothetical protein